jgi:hypothetical protein
VGLLSRMPASGRSACDTILLKSGGTSAHGSSAESNPAARHPPRDLSITLHDHYEPSSRSATIGPFMRRGQARWHVDGMAYREGILCTPRGCG